MILCGGVVAVKLDKQAACPRRPLLTGPFGGRLIQSLLVQLFSVTKAVVGGGGGEGSVRTQQSDCFRCHQPQLYKD